jgi:DNA repair exonuclease SbcCD ATPase subunit
MSRELSGGQLPTKRSSAGRKQSPAASGAESSLANVEDLQKNAVNNDRDETLEKLADRLKSLQHENENVEKQTIDEEEEHIALLKELEKQRDDLRKRVKEKDEASGDLRKHVYKLESVNRTVQSEKAKRERLLQQKESERKKRKDDIVRWRERMARMAADAAQAKEEKASLEEDGKKRADEVREKIAKEQSEMKIIDDEIQDKGGRVKKLEEERKNHQGPDSEDGKELDRIDHERARQWEIKLSNLHARYATLVNIHAQVCSFLEPTFEADTNLCEGPAAVSRSTRAPKVADNTRARKHRALFSPCSRSGSIYYGDNPSTSSSQLTDQQCLVSHELYGHGTFILRWHQL